MLRKRSREMTLINSLKYTSTLMLYFPTVTRCKSRNIFSIQYQVISNIYIYIYINENPKPCVNTFFLLIFKFDQIHIWNERMNGLHNSTLLRPDPSFHGLKTQTYIIVKVDSEKPNNVYVIKRCMQLSGS